MIQNAVASIRQSLDIDTISLMPRHTLYSVQLLKCKTEKRIQHVFFFARLDPLLQPQTLTLCPRLSYDTSQVNSDLF